MNPIVHMATQITRRILGSTVKITKPKNIDGHWWLDATAKDQSIVIMWAQGKGFGITARDDVAYGMGADEFIETENSTLERVLHLLRTGEKTIDPAP